MSSLQQLVPEPQGLRLLGLHLHCISYDDMFTIFDRWLNTRSNRGFSVAAVNVNVCVSSLLDRRVRQVYQEADLRGVDGMPFVYLARLFSNSKTDQLCAPAMILECAKEASKHGYKFFLYGGWPGAPEAMSVYLRNINPELKIVGTYSPPFRSLTPEEDEEVMAMIVASGANLVWVGLGSPKQDVWIRQHRDRLPGCILIASGATFDFYAGLVRRAPMWMTRGGLEWLFRLTQDPIRLWKRYTVYNILFAGALFLELIGLLHLDNKRPALSVRG